ncbi:aldose epimerase [Moorena sp. SIO3H5]|uniref:aldose epimerase family protein n=1 Tax=Moorena sp. SIO3H5 TaxID=2607834 RepID=UPI0013BDCF4E|nr:aldose epimerase [Moorena sp. SIO3H5]NEO68442.1 aldose epimerase [Moorena sp. SIO3H5]
MFEIVRTQDQYETYILTDHNAQSRLEVVPERGGIVTRWNIQGQEIFYLDAERFKDPHLSVRGGIPILFPICGNLVNDTYTYLGQDYTLKQHGFARNLPWQVTDSATSDMAVLTITLKSNDQTRSVYPFDFEVTFTYRLKGNTLDIDQRYTNHSAEAMPFSTGFHPYFLTSDKTKLEFDIPASEYQEKQTQAVHPFTGSFDFSCDEIDVAFGQLSDKTASVTDRERGLAITLTYTDAYSTLVFWTVQGKDFYCLEPWSAPRNALNTGENLTHLAPGESSETSVRLTAKFF